MLSSPERLGCLMVVVAWHWLLRIALLGFRACLEVVRCARRSASVVGNVPALLLCGWGIVGEIAWPQYLSDVARRASLCRPARFHGRSRSVCARRCQGTASLARGL